MGNTINCPALAADLVRRGVAVIAATSTPAGLPAKAATATIPIVFVTTLAVELGQKRMELMRQVVPTAKLMGVLINPTGPNLESVSRDLENAARKIGQPIHVLHASTEHDFDGVFEQLTQIQVEGLVIGTDTFFNSQSAKLATLALRHRMPAIYQYREFVAAGGLMSYAGSIADAYRVAGVYTSRVLKGERPPELPVQQSEKAELFLNLNTAKTLGLTIPPSLLARADEVIE